MRKEYPLSKEEMSLYLACTLNPGRKKAYLVGWSVELPVDTDKTRIENAVIKLFEKHRIFTARIEKDEQGRLYKYDCGEKPVIEYDNAKEDPPSPEDYYPDMDLNGGRMYRIVIADTPSSVVLFMIFHHIILDGTGRQIMVRDFEAAFGGLDIGGADFLPYELAQKEIESEKEAGFEKDREYYRELLSDIECQFPEPDVYDEEESFSQRFYPFDSINGADVKNKKDTSGVRTSTIFLGAAGYALAVFAGSEQSVVASAMSGRTDEIKGSCGMFVRTLPMVCNTDPSRTVDEYLKDLDDQTTGGREHSLYTYLDLSHELKLSLQISFAYQGDMTADRIMFDGEERRMGFLRADPSDYEMRLYLWRKDGRYLFEVLYRSDHYSEGYIDSLAQTVEQVLSELLKKEKMSDIVILPKKQKELLDGFNDAEREYDERDVVTRFREQAARVPGNTAVIFKDKKFSYREVDDYTERLAACLKNRGIGREDVVSVLIPRSEYMVLASLGVLKSGAAYQPLDPSYPSERLEFMISDAGAGLLIADRALIDRVPGYKGDVLFLDEADKLPDAGTAGITPGLKDRFIMLYTSGTTGVPKGVMLEHGNLAAFCSWYKHFYSLSDSSRVAAYASYGFDANMMDMYPALTTGACVVIIPEEDRLDLAAIKKRFDETGVTHSFMTTQVCRQFAEYYDGGSLKYLSAGGEKLAPVYVDKGFKLYNGYGPTECTIFSTIFEVDRLYHRIPIGRPLDNMKLYVCDGLLRRLPAGAPGELIISGHQVGRGYLNRPEKNAEVFIDNPFENGEGYARAYRTGDIVRCLPDGNIDCIGRNDGQVKIRGFRVELPEIEAVIREYPGIRDVTVQAFEASGGGKFIAAYIVSDKPVDTAGLNEYIGSRKPPYMIPAVTMQIEKIPLNQNQKVNKRALPEPVFDDKADSDGETRELNSLEKKIISVINEAVRDVNIGVTGKLTDYGLDSINSIRLIPVLNERFGISLSVVKLLDGMSVLDIENEIIDKWSSIVSNGGKTEDKKASGKADRSFSGLSRVQMSVYYDAVKKSDDCLYNIPACYDFKDADALKLKTATEAAIAAHPLLNTHLKQDKGEVLLVYNDPADPVVSLKEMEGTGFEEYVKKFVLPFDLMRGPLYRAEVIKTEGSAYLLLDVHHLVYDGFSSSILIDDICKALKGEEIKREEYTGFDLAADEEESENSPEYEKARAYHKERFKLFDEPTVIPPDLPGKEEDGLMGIVSMTACTKKEADECCREAGATPAALFLAAAVYASSRFAGTKKVAISTLSSGREDVRTARSVGMFVHTIPLLFDLEKSISGSGFVKEAGMVLRDGIRNEIFPYMQIVSEYGYDTGFMYEYQAGVTGKNDDCERIPIALEAPKFKTALLINEEGGGYKVTVRYNDALYSRDYMDTFARSVTNVVRTLINTPETDVTSISLMDDKETEKVLGFGMTCKCDIPDKLLHKAFETAALKFGERDALITSEGTWTFKELNDASDIVASNLSDKGVKKGDSIVLLLPRRRYYFAALFGVLKTGAAFIPCDPEYPAERISHIISDAGARFMITTKEQEESYQKEDILLIDTLLEGRSSGDISADVNPDDLAYMIYTSGSTGKPKGVELTHLGICNYINACEGSPFFSHIAKGPVRVVSVTTVSFDMSFKDTVGVLVNGGTVIFTNEEEMNDPRALSEALKIHKADIFSSTPSRILQYMEYEPFKEALSKCSLVICGGEAYPAALLNKLRELNIGRIMNSYGPTEITVSSNMADLTTAEKITIGRPLPNYIEYIVDTDGNPVPAGVTGELLIGGPSVARGYRNLPEMTEKSFVEYRGGRVYRSGDYARWDKEGNVTVLGRRDNQIKLRGLRIETDEISGLIGSQDGIKKAVVVIRKISGQDNLCAYFTADREIDVKELREALKKKLTKYMVPTAYMQLKEIPMTPNGKTDIRSLPEPLPVSSGEYVAPNGEAEECFAKIFAGILKLERVGATDDFFEIGGTSLIAASVVIEADKKGYKITFGDLFKHKTPRALAAFVSGTDETPDTDMSGAGDFSGYDHEMTGRSLSRNTMEAFLKGESQDIGNILLTGATGFMGIHLLAQYLKNEEGTAYCFVRPRRGRSGVQRLNELLYYYFGDMAGSMQKDIFNSMKERIKTVEGDMTDPESLEKLKGLPIDTVFNCAANVKHFSGGTDIEDVNVGGVKNCIRYCLDTGTRLVHFSTVSVSGTISDSPENAGMILNEHNMYFGQELDNQYTSSKLRAELEVMKAVTGSGLNAKIIRVATLAARERDGEFQANYLSNSFAGKLRSYFVLGAFPYSMMDSPVRMGPIDASCEAFLKLSRTPVENRLFHAVNNRIIPLSAIINVMRDCGIKIDYVEDEEFDRRFAAAQEDPAKVKILQSISAYKALHSKAGMRDVSYTCEFTTQVLARMGFFWPQTGTDYLERFVNGLIGLGFFDEEFLNR